MTLIFSPGARLLQSAFPVKVCLLSVFLLQCVTEVMSGVVVYNMLSVGIYVTAYFLLIGMFVIVSIIVQTHIFQQISLGDAHRVGVTNQIALIVGNAFGVASSNVVHELSGLKNEEWSPANVSWQAWYSSALAGACVVTSLFLK